MVRLVKDSWLFVPLLFLLRPLSFSSTLGFLSLTSCMLQEKVEIGLLSCTLEDRCTLLNGFVVVSRRAELGRREPDFTNVELCDNGREFSLATSDETDSSLIDVRSIAKGVSEFLIRSPRTKKYRRISVKADT